MPPVTPSKKWLKITLPCPESMDEAVSDLLGVLSGVGVEIHPDEQSGLHEISGFFALEDSGGHSTGKVAETLPEQVAVELKTLFAVYDRNLPELKTEIFADQEWATSWQQYFKSFEITPGLVIKPSWETFVPETDQHVLEMDPGMAFGTGQHESTRLALALLSSCFKNYPGRINTVLDVGTGTGILSMAAAVFGAGQVVAIDNDPEAVVVARGNIAHNNLSARITVSATPLAEITGVFDLICANIVHDVLAEMVPHFRRLTVSGGHVILAGILAGAQEKSIGGLYERCGMKIIACRTEGDWSGLLFRRIA